MISFGLKNKKIKEGFLTTCSCNNCGKTEENKFVVYCTVFILGPIFWPWVWWGWNKNIYIECSACNKHFNFNELEGDIKDVATESLKEIKIPFTYYFLAIIFALRILFYFI